MSSYIEIDLLQSEQLAGDRENFVDFSKLSVKKIKGVRGLFGNATYHVQLNNTFRAKASLYIKQGGEYRKMPYRLPEKGVCDFFNEDDIFYPELSQKSNFMKPVPCPPPAVSYFFLGNSPCFHSIINL